MCLMLQTSVPVAVFGFIMEVDMVHVVSAELNRKLATMLMETWKELEIPP